MKRLPKLNAKINTLKKKSKEHKRLRKKDFCLITQAILDFVAKLLLFQC
jgi:hypothetical protein